MLRFLLIIFLLILTNHVSALEPSDNSNDTTRRTRSTSSRGCPVKTGEFYLIGTQEKDRTYLEVNVAQPNVVFEVNSKRHEILSISLTRIDGKIKRTLLYETEIETTGQKAIVLKLPKLESETKSPLLLTTVLLCDGQPYYGQLLNAWLVPVSHKTATDHFLQWYSYQNR